MILELKTDKCAPCACVGVCVRVCESVCVCVVPTCETEGAEERQIQMLMMSFTPRV